MAVIRPGLRRGGRPMPRRPSTRSAPRGGERPDERKGTCASLVSCCLGLFVGPGISAGRAMADNGPGHRSGGSDDLLGSRGVRHPSAKPIGPWRNDRARRTGCMIMQDWERPRLGQQGREGVRPPGLHRAPRSRRPPPMSRIDLKGDKQPIGIRHLGVLGLIVLIHNRLGVRLLLLRCGILAKKHL